MVLGGAESLRYDSRWQQHMATAPLSSPNAPGTPRTARPETGRSADARPPTATRLAVLHRQALAPGYSQGHNTSTMGENTTAGIPRSRGLGQYSFRSIYNTFYIGIYLNLMPAVRATRRLRPFVYQWP
jgi:hypothetical protein